MENNILKFSRVESNIFVKDLRNTDLNILASKLIELRFGLDFETDSENCANFYQYDVNVKEFEEFLIVEVYVSTTGEKRVTVYNHIQNDIKLDLENEESIVEFLTKTLKAVDDLIALDQQAREEVRNLKEFIKKRSSEGEEMKK